MQFTRQRSSLITNITGRQTYNQLVGDFGRRHAEAHNVQDDVILEDVSWRLHPDDDSETHEQTNWTKRRQHTCTLSAVTTSKHHTNKDCCRGQQCDILPHSSHHVPADKNHFPNRQVSPRDMTINNVWPRERDANQVKTAVARN